MGVLEQRAGGSPAVQDALAAAAAHAVFFEQLRSTLGQAQSKIKNCDDCSVQFSFFYNLYVSNNGRKEEKLVSSAAQ